MTTTGVQRSLLDLPAVAEQLSVNERHVRRLVAERRIPFIKWGHLLRFDPDEIARWLDDARVSEVTAPGTAATGRRARP